MPPPRPRTVLLVALILAAEHHCGDSLCIQVRLIKFLNRYNTVQIPFNNGYPTCCDDLERMNRNNVKSRCMGNQCNRCTHTFRIELSTPGNVRNSGWSGTKWGNNVDFPDWIGFVSGDKSYRHNYPGFRNDFWHCQKIVGGRPKPVRVFVHAVDSDKRSSSDFVTYFEVIIDPYNTGLKYRRIATWSMWKKERWFAQANKEHNAPYYLEFDVRARNQDHDPKDFWTKGDHTGSVCSTKDSSLYQCRLLPAGAASRRAGTVSTAPAPAPPPAASLALLLLAARAAAL